jgi:hypothetical protein
VALQGTIDAFPLVDVLGLLSSSSKTGRLVLSGDRGRVALVVESGSVIGADWDGPDGAPAELPVLEMLRFAEGEFEFDADPDGHGEHRPVGPMPISECVAAAQELLARWVEVEQLVPSARHRIALVPELDDDRVEIDAGTWRVLAAAGSSVAQLAERLALDEFSATCAVAELVGRGLVVLDEPAEPDDDVEAEEADLSLLDAVGADSVLPELVGVPSEHVDAEPSDGNGDASGFPDHFPIDDLIGVDPATDEDDPWSSPEMEQLEAQRFAAAQSFEPVEVEPLPLVDLEPVSDAFRDEPDPAAAAALLGDAPATAPPVDEPTDEVLRQMSKLSPKAAEAIAAALNTVPGATPEHAEDDDRRTPFGGSF